MLAAGDKKDSLCWFKYRSFLSPMKVRRSQVQCSQPVGAFRALRGYKKNPEKRLPRCTRSDKDKELAHWASTH